MVRTSSREDILCRPHSQIEPKPQETYAYAHDLTASQYKSYSEAKVAEGFQPISISGYTKLLTKIERQTQNIQRVLTCCLTSQDIAVAPEVPAPGPRERFSAVFCKKGGENLSWASHHSMTTEVFENQHQIHTGAGLKLTIINGFVGPDGQARFSAIWKRKPQRIQMAKWNISSDEFRGWKTTKQSQGYQPEHISGYTHHGRTMFAAILVLGQGSPVALHNLSASAFQEEHRELCRTGYMPCMVSVYMVNKMDTYAAIWRRIRPRPAVVRHQLTSAQLEAENESLYFRGYHIRQHCAYILNNTTYWAVIWTSHAYTCKQMLAIDSPIQKYMAKWGVHGLSLAITYRHRLVFARGYGHTDNTQIEHVQPNHIFRVASVSKWLTAVATMRLVQDDKISLDSKVFGPGSIIGTSLTPLLANNSRLYPPRLRRITVQHLLEHTAGVNVGADWAPVEAENTTQGRVRWYLQHWLPHHPMQDEPGTKHEYSNWGYLFLALVIERTTSWPYDEYIRHKLFGKPSPRIFVPHCYARLLDEVSYYASPSAQQPEDYYIGMGDNGAGSWVAEPKTLLALLARTDGTDHGTATSRSPMVLTRGSFELMRAPCRLNSAFGKGLIRGGTGLDGWVGHNGKLQGSHSWLVRRDDGVSYMAVTNTTEAINSDVPGVMSDELAYACQIAIAGILQWPSCDLFL